MAKAMIGKSRLQNRRCMELNLISSTSHSGFKSFPEASGQGRLRDPLHSSRILGELFIDGRRVRYAKFRIGTCGPADQFGRRIGRIALPLDAVIPQERKPGQAAMRAYAVIYEPILPVAPGAEDHPGLGIAVDDAMCPAGGMTILSPGLASMAMQRPGRSSAVSCA